MKGGIVDTILELDSVSMSYHAKAKSFNHGLHSVLDGVSLSLKEGETLGLIGKNGCGKTTILRVMAGILAPTRGQVTRREGASAALLTLGLGFKPLLSGRDNAIIAAMLQGSTQSQARDYLEEIRNFSELGDSFDEPVRTYSAGMKARLGFTTALITHVDILLIDEILSVGDAQFRKKAAAALKQRISGDQTVVFVSHSENLIRSICDRAVWLNAGKISAEGKPEDVLTIYADYLSSVRKVL